jgi:hypothetical protein
VHALRLTALDRDDPHASAFLPGTVPAVHDFAPAPAGPATGIPTPSSSRRTSDAVAPGATVFDPAQAGVYSYDPLAGGAGAHGGLPSPSSSIGVRSPPTRGAAPPPPPARCGCPARPADAVTGYHGAWTPPATLSAWDSSWSAGQVRREECRRTCWAAVMMAARYAGRCAVFEEEPMELALLESGNVSPCFFFPPMIVCLLVFAADCAPLPRRVP